MPPSPDKLATKGLLGQLKASSPEGKREEAKQQAAARNSAESPERHKGVPRYCECTGSDRVAAALAEQKGRAGPCRGWEHILIDEDATHSKYGKGP